MRLWDMESNLTESVTAVGRFPKALTIAPDGKTACTANDGSDTVTPIQIASNTAGKPIITGRYPDSIVMAP